MKMRKREREGDSLLYNIMHAEAHFAYDELFLFIIWQASTKMAAAAIHNAVAFWGEKKIFSLFSEIKI